jgi:hypothetical protein
VHGGRFDVTFLRSTPLLVAMLAVACVPEFDDDATRIAGRRVIAIQSTPAEVDLRLVTASRETLVEAVVAEVVDQRADDVEWTLCIDRKPLSELGPVSRRCLESPNPGADIAVPLGRGASVPAMLPELACQLFGPERPDPEPGEPAGRPVDPDPTGGFYQPVLAWLDGEVVLGGVRITCGLFNVAPNVSTEFTARYRVNQNPAIERLELVASDGSVTELDPEGVTRVRAGESYDVRAIFPACPSEPECGDGICGPDETSSDAFPDLSFCPDDCTTPLGCGGAEEYVVYDPENGRVETRRESVVVSWFSTAGTFSSERTGDTGAVGSLRASENDWKAPGEGPVRIWAVLRDDRGGVANLQANLAAEN